MLSDFFIDFCRVTDTTAPDGFGGVTHAYTDGASFRAGIYTNTSTEAQIAQQNGLKTIYTIAHPLDVSFQQDDLVKRVSDGQIFRITSQSVDNTTPEIATTRFAWVTAEVVDP